MRRLFSMVFSLILLGLVVYNVRQVSSLRHEVSDLKSQVAAVRAGHGGQSSDDTSPVSRAMKHVDLAKKYALKGDFKRANKELDRGAEVLQKAGRDVTGPYAQTTEKTERALTEARKSIERLWQKGEKSPKKGKGG